MRGWTADSGAAAPEGLRGGTRKGFVSKEWAVGERPSHGRPINRKAGRIHSRRGGEGGEGAQRPISKAAQRSLHKEKVTQPLHHWTRETARP